MRRAFAVVLLLAGCSKTPQQPDERGVAWLMSKQSPDGAWRSSTYKVLESGRVLTPFLLWALAQQSPERLSKHQSAMAKAFANAAVDEAYPTYSRALWVLALVAHKPAGWQERVSALERELRESQLVERLGWSAVDPEYGAWDMGVVPARKPEAQRPDVSVTAFAVEALRAAGASESDPACVAAKMFTTNVIDREEGGAFFTPSATWAHQNKAGEKRPYGTATADALRIRRACGVPDGDRSSTRLLAWIDDRFRLDAAPGFAAGGDRWDAALQYYWLLVVARLGHRGVDVRARVATLQRADGSWANAIALMKEDDPLVATGLALAAWGMAR
jgi:squalene-hopene/tetraprenyl-beta-curcumene cyclase